MKDNSGPAFPTTSTPGMTKRELIAMHILGDAPGNKYEYSDNAEWAVKQADALLAVLAKKKP